MAQSVKHPTSAQVTILQCMSSSPTLRSVLTAWSLELLQILGLTLSLPLPCSPSKINKHQNNLYIYIYLFIYNVYTYIYMCVCVCVCVARGIWVAQWVKHPTSAQVTILQLVSLSLALDSALTAWRLEPASDSVSPSLSAPPLFVLCLSLKYK